MQPDFHFVRGRIGFSQMLPFCSGHSGLCSLTAVPFIWALKTHLDNQHFPLVVSERKPDDTFKANY